RLGIAEDLDDDDSQHAEKYHPAKDDQRREPASGAVDAAFKSEQKPGVVHRSTSGRQEDSPSGYWSYQADFGSILAPGRERRIAERVRTILVRTRCAAQPRLCHRNRLTARTQSRNNSLMLVLDRVRS